MSAYDEAAAAFIEAAGPVAAYCQRTARPNRHADQLDTFLLRGAELGAAADALQAGYQGTARIQAFCAGIRARLSGMLTPQVPDPLRPLAGSLTSHCLPLPAHVRHLAAPAQPLCPLAAHATGGDPAPVL